MPHNDRHLGFRRPELERGGRMRNESRWDEGRAGFDEHRPHSGSDFSEEFDTRPPGSREHRRDKRLMHWDSLNQSGDYYGTGVYHGAVSTQPGARASGGELWEPGQFGDDRVRTWDEPRDEDAYRTSGDYDVYGRSRYGAQSGYARDYGPARGTQRGYGQDYRERFAEERYGREPEYGYGFGQSPYKSEAGQFRGRGPKGYERSDERLREIICERLTDEPSIDASEVSLEVEDKVVKLTGFVSDRRTKYEIEDLVEACGGVKDIDNQIRVKRQ